MDVLTPEQRKGNMKSIRSKDTKYDVLVRKALFAEGFRFRKNDKRLPGTPDIVLPKYKTVVFINGCFWHRHPGCKYATTPKTNVEFWNKKFEANVKKDISSRESLEAAGWNVVVLWECELKKDFDSAMNSLKQSVLNNPVSNK